MDGKSGSRKSASEPDPEPEGSGASRASGELPAAAGQGAAHEAFGVLELERMAKDDGRALLVFRRAEGR